MEGQECYPPSISIDRSLKGLMGSCQFSTEEGSRYQRRAENDLLENERAKYSSLSSQDHTVKKFIFQQHIQACQAIGKSIQENAKQPAAVCPSPYPILTPHTRTASVQKSLGKRQQRDCSPSPKGETRQKGRKNKENKSILHICKTTRVGQISIVDFE